MNHVELFAGIGGFRRALTLLERDYGVRQATVAFSEIDANALKTYRAVYDTQEECEIGDIVSFAQDRANIESLPPFELLTGGFPCQAFSMMGKQEGFRDERGNVVFRLMQVLKYRKPRYVLLENVRNLITHNKGKTFAAILSALRSCGYSNVYYDVFNTENFGLAQKRNRVFIFATTEDIPNFVFNSGAVEAAFARAFEDTSLLRQNNTHEILEKDADARFFLSDTVKPTILSDGTKTYQSKSEINPLIAKPLTATMVKLHRACQDNYFSEGYIKAQDPVAYRRHVYTKQELLEQSIRRITPREAFLLQGFSEDFFERAQRAGVSNTQLYRQAGNAVSVNTVYAIFYYLFVHCGLH